MERDWQQLVTLFVLLVFFVLGIFGVIWSRGGLTKTPTVSVNLDDTTVTDKESVSVTGKAENTKTLLVNGQEVSLDKDGNFSATVNLNEGDNNISVEAQNGSKKADVNKVVVRQAPQQNVAGSTNGSGATNQNGDLNNSGPVEDVMGVFGLCAIILSLFYYFETKKKAKFSS